MQNTVVVPAFPCTVPMDVLFTELFWDAGIEQKLAKLVATVSKPWFIFIS